MSRAYGYTHGNKLCGVKGLAVGPAGQEIDIFDEKGYMSMEYSSAVVGNVEPLVFSTTLTGAGATAGRARFQLDTNVALGGWANALKAYTKFGETGRITGLASAFCAEMDLSAGCTQGNYAPLELELNLGTGAKTGVKTALIYASVNGAGAGEFDDKGVLINLQGLNVGAGNVFQTAAKDGVKSTHALKILIGTTPYYIPISTAADFNT